MKTARLLFLLALQSLVPFAAHANWLVNGVPLCVLDNDQTHSAIVSDGAGGAIVSWQDLRIRISDIYAQRINASGVVQWTANGVGVCTATGDQLSQVMVADGAGGAVIAWEDRRDVGITGVDVYAQRISAAGVVQWAANGVVLCKAIHSSDRLDIAADGTGGAIVTWEDDRGANYDIYAQRIDGTGAVQWTADGVPLSVAALDQQYPKIAPDGAGGGIVAWNDFRSGIKAYIYVQRIDASGAVLWTPDGARVCPNADQQGTPYIASDGAGGAIVAWHDYRNSNDEDIYAQRINGSNVAQWAINGVSVCTIPGPQAIHSMISDGAGGAIMGWVDGRNGTGNYDIYAQRLDASGTALWMTDGVALCTAPGVQFAPTVASGGTGAAVVAWEDFRNGIDNNIYAQRVSPAGAVQWAANGVAMCTSVNEQSATAIASDGSGGGIAAWQDFRGGASFDIYAMRLDSQGSPTGVSGSAPALAMTVGDSYPNPFSVGTQVDLVLRSAEPVSVEVFDVSGRRVRNIEFGRLHAGASRLTFDGLDDRAHALPSGVYFCQVHAGSETVTKKMVIAR